MEAIRYIHCAKQPGGKNGGMQGKDISRVCNFSDHTTTVNDNVRSP